MNYSDKFEPERIRRHGTRRYLAPEVLNKTLWKPDIRLDFSSYKKADIYCLSLVFWEIISRTKFSEEHNPAAFKIPFLVFETQPEAEELFNKIRLENLRPAFPG